MSDSAALAERRVLDLLGLAARAGSVVTGTDAVRQAVRDGEVALVVFAGDVSDTQRRKVAPLLEARGVPSLTLFSRERLGAALGRGPLSAVGVGQTSFARRVAELASALSSPQE